MLWLFRVQVSGGSASTNHWRHSSGDPMPQGGYIGDYIGEYDRGYKGDARNVGDSSDVPREPAMRAPSCRRSARGGPRRRHLPAAAAAAAAW